MSCGIHVFDTGILPSLDTFYDFLEKPMHFLAAEKVVSWRFENVNIWRKIVTGISLAVLGIAGLIETIVRLAFVLLAAPITIPLEFYNYSFFKKGIKGTLTTLFSAGKCFTSFQYQNIKGNTEKN